MKLPRARFMIRRVIVAVALVICLAATDELILFASEPVYVAVSAVVAGLFGLGAMRHPWFFLAVVIVLRLGFPDVSDSSAHSMFVGSYVLGWAFGAPAGWIIRSLADDGSALPADPAPSEPK